MERKAYPSDGSDEECAFVDPYPALMLELTEQSVELAYVDQGYALLPRRWIVERSFGWAARFRRLAIDYERLPESLAGLHYLAFAMLMLKNFVQLMAHVL
jgi:hypothetical protein